MKTRNRFGWLLALTLLIAGCAGTEGTRPATEASLGTTADTSPASTNQSPSTTSESTGRTVLRPWGYEPAGREIELSLVLPDSWEISEGVIAKGDAEDGTHMRFGSGFVGDVFADRCQWTGTALDPALGPTVEDLVTAFSTIWGSDATTAVDETVDGFEGKYMVLTVPTDADFTECDGQHFVGWSEAGHSEPSRWYQGPGQILKHWILDVDGVRLVIEASHFPQQSSEGLAELEGIIDSIEIVTG
ncbi:MAG TPA: hypothetical protein VJ935_05195 [Acidimicrobiia bacterium]|nr:hypothetical protein [Acidimicrobiia bacterium]